MKDVIYLFNGQQAKFTSAVFITFEKAKAWVEQHHLSGILIEYPLDTGCYDWAIEQGHFVEFSPIDRAPIFIENFISIYQKSWHFAYGEMLSSATYKDLIQ